MISVNKAEQYEKKEITDLEGAEKGTKKYCWGLPREWRRLP